MSEQLQFKCPCCGGALVFESALQKVKCPYCDTEFDMETLRNYDADLGEEQKEGADFQPPQGEDGEFQSYVCTSCGGEILTEPQTAATVCPFCSNPVVFKGKVSGVLKPELVIPFRLDKNAAKNALLQHCKGKRLLPKEFKDENHLDKIQGIYVPYWLFDARADADVRARATRHRFWSDRKYNYTETSYFLLRRKGGLTFAHVPVDGSKKLDDTLMESIEPFDYTQGVDFQTAYLAGYLADRYDVSSGESISRARERMKKSAEQTVLSTVGGYDSVTVESTAVNVTESKVTYALLPVWILNTSWHGKDYIFAMNGQTGRFVGDLPLDKKLKNKWFWGLTGAVTAAVFALSCLVWLL